MLSSWAVNEGCAVVAVGYDLAPSGNIFVKVIGYFSCLNSSLSQYVTVNSGTIWCITVLSLFTVIIPW